MSIPYDALLVVSFGGPDGPDDVLPFLENVTRGRGVPRERLLEVADHYQHFGGRSPINEQNQALIVALSAELKSHGIDLPIYWGNRNWHPLLAETVKQMADDGVKHALAYVTSAYSSYSSCRQYRENIEAAREAAGPSAPAIDKIRPFFNHPGYLETMTELTRAAIGELPVDERDNCRLLFTAHSIPTGMAATCRYVSQLEESSRLVAEGVGNHNWRLVYQSRSGPPQVPWLEPDICDVLRELAAQSSATSTKASAVVIVPIGFLSDHIEVLFDLDTEARQVCDELGLTMVRGSTAGTHPRFVRMVRELIEERLGDSSARAYTGAMGALPDFCAADCCLYTPRRPAANAETSAGGPR